MTPREIILANLDHTGPPRHGMNFTCGRMDDFCIGGLEPSKTYSPNSWVENRMEYNKDEWGNVWRRMLEGSSRGEVHEPAIKDWGNLDSLALPDYDNPGRYESVREGFRQAGDRFRLAAMPGWVFATSRYLRKMEVYFADLIEYREEVNRLHEIVTGLLEKTIRLFAGAGADGIMFAEDLGVQDRLLVSPAMWRDVFRPHYLRLTGAARDCGLRIFMHSCGYNWDLIDDLAEAGIEVFQFDQPAAYDLPALAAKFREKKLTLYSPVDIQKILPTGDREMIEAEAQRMLGLFGGFFIAKDYPDLPGIGVKPEWDDWAYRVFLREAERQRR